MPVWLFAVASVLVLFSVCTGAQQHNVEPQTIRVPAQVFEDNTIHNYFVNVLTLALEKTQQGERPFEIQPDPFNANQDRLLRQVKEGTTDVTWAVTSIEREYEHQPVYFPLARGLLGYRLFLIHPDRMSEFSLLSAQDLKNKVAVQGIGWPDTDVMRFNGYQVEEQPFSMLFKIIDKNMADYFPRSAMEIHNELNSRASLNLQIESSKAFYYPSPMYFFVSKRNSQLALRIKRGLDMALDDGSLVSLFNQTTFASAANEMLIEREIIVLKNPILSKQSEQTLRSYNAFLLSH